MIGKTELAQRLAQRTGLATSRAAEVLNAVFDTVTEALASGEEVRITGFGTFRVAQTRERRGRHPRTGEPMVIPGRKRPAFSAGSALVEAVQKGKAPGG